MAITNIRCDYTLKADTIAKSPLSTNAWSAKMAAITLVAATLSLYNASIDSDSTSVTDNGDIVRRVVIQFPNDDLFPTTDDKIAICRHLYQGVLQMNLAAPVDAAEPVFVGV